MAGREPAAEREVHGNPNTLTLDRGASGLSQGSVAQTYLVEARRFEGAVPPVTVLPEIVQPPLAAE